MPTFLTIGYGDQAGYDATDEIVRAEAHRHDAALAATGVVIGQAGEPVQVRNHGGQGTRTTAGPYLRAGLPVAGFAVIEATDLAEAVELVSASPCAVAGGVVEVWPIL
jgi:hypothetical protein